MILARMNRHEVTIERKLQEGIVELCDWGVLNGAGMLHGEKVSCGGCLGLFCSIRGACLRSPGCGPCAERRGRRRVVNRTD